MISSLLLLFLTLFPQEKPLPELKSFLNEFQAKRPGFYKALGAWGISDYKVRNKYSFTETCTELTLASDGKVKSADKNVYDVIPSSGPIAIYRRQIVKDGVPLSAKELEKEDREFDAASDKLKEQRRKSAEKAAAAPKPATTIAPAPQESIFLQIFDYEMVRRESIDGHSVILLNFKPKPGAKPTDYMAKMLQHTAGRVWVSEEDYEPARVEVEVIDPISIGVGILAKIQKGSKASMEWRKINEEIWLPYKREFAASARVLLLKGMRRNEATEFSNYKKSSVDTELKIGPAIE